MTAIQQLTMLHSQFPRATELAISDALLAQLELELATADRFKLNARPHARYRIPWFVTETFEHITAQRLALMFKDKRLTLVKPR